MADSRKLGAGGLLVGSRSGEHPGPAAGGERLRGPRPRTCELRPGQRVEDLGVFKVTKEGKWHERWHASELCKRLDDADPNLSYSKGTDSWLETSDSNSISR
jgi:hypothetical protein